MLLFLLCVWRAATQSVSHDEALTWLYYLDEPLSAMFRFWQANNHVLHTLLAWFSVHAFGSSELALRLPALLGAALFLIALRRLARRALGDGPLHLLALVLVAANPLVLDLLVAARGYGLALALLLWAANVLLSGIDAEAAGGAPRAGPWWRASLLLGLMATANLAYAPAGLGLLGAAWLAGPRRPARLLLLLLLPGAALAALLLWSPMQGVTGEEFIVGVDSLALSCDSLVRLSFAHHPAPWLPGEYGGLLNFVLFPAGRVLAAVLLLLLLARVPRWLRGGGDADERVLQLLGGALLLALAGLVAGHVAVGLLYPTDRTALCLLPLALLPALVLVARGLAGRWQRAARAALWLLVAWGVVNVAALQTQRFALWPMDAGARRTFDVMQARQEQLPRRGVQLRVAHRFLAPAIQFYRASRQADWLAPVPAEWDRGDHDLDYLLVPAGDWGDVLAGDPERFNILYEDPVSEVRLALPKHRHR